jgi:long-chain fatty acid transport protein
VKRLAFALCLAASPAAASVLDLYGFNPRGTAMGNAQAAAADDYTATFYNPAAMTQHKKVNVGAGFVATFPQLRVDRDRPTPAQREVPTELPPDFSGFNLGALFPLGGKFDHRVAVGLAMYLPTLNLLRGEGVDSRVPQFYRYQNLPDKYVLLASAAFEFGPWLSVGAGVQTLAGLDGGVDLDLEVANRRVRQRAVQVDVFPTAAPVAGLFSQPTRSLRLGASWRSELQLDYSLPSAIRIDDLLDLNLDIGGTVLFSPHTFNFGVAYDVARWHLLLSGEVSYELWSRAPDPSPRFTVDIAGEIPEGLGIGEALDIGNGAPVVLNFRDVPVFKAGLEHRPAGGPFAVRAGYTWRPTPSPVPTGAFNYIDNDAHILAAGAGFTFADPLEMRQQPLHVDVVYQATLLVDQHVAKSRGVTDPVGDYTAGGTIHSFGISLRHDL